MLQRLAITAALAFSTVGCLVNITHVSNPDKYFDEAMRNARSVEGKRGPAREIHVLVYDADDRKLVRLDLPLGLVRRITREADFDWDLNFDLCESSKRGCSEARHRLRKFRGRDLDRLPLGPLVEVSDDDGERIFVYLR